MSWGLVAGAAATVGSGVMGSNAADKAARRQQESADAGIASQERMFDKSLELQQPYRDAGYAALPDLQRLSTAKGRNDELQGFYAGPEFKQLQAQTEEQQLRNAAATGGIRGGANQAALATIAPQLGQQYLSSRYNNLTGLANMGMGAASQGASGALGLGQGMSALQQQAGAAQAQNALAQGNIWGNVASDFGGMAYNYFNRPQQKQQAPVQQSGGTLSLGVL